MAGPQLPHDPLEHYLSHWGFDPLRVDSYVAGAKYFALMLDSGNIGISAIYEHLPDDSLLRGATPDLTNMGHRIILNAWFNALLNYDTPVDGDGDIFDVTDFSRYDNIVMIGWFGTLLDKMESYGVKPVVFDRLHDDPVLAPPEMLEESLAGADSLIITGTTISNNTFSGIVSATAAECDTLLLGPSNILHRDMFRYRNIKVIFGSLFRNGDTGLLDLVAMGHGTRELMGNLKKVYICKDNWRL